MKTSAHCRIGVDAHKRFSQIHVLADGDSTAWKGLIENNDPAAFEDLVRTLGDRFKAVFEASMNWHVLHGILCAIEGIDEVVMAHPLICSVSGRGGTDLI